ncbi:hypothetical protein [Mesorhizobium sp. M7A.F.Ca.MR.362.00.0.0]|uniref:hypothetical protein n=1 Tax=Mesorhizobium sp. M7A.F.Ca.MR.362.00.0.0 TaxID=2496779 RepID=UPI000FD599ED|nr:hypothetical protein [Mesorhizobium sp. M7A.F.Ca.MR.362.00.0.0]RUU80474.1 hypothetical protein EOC06_12020 [Mesorhizobium sp. M7A.F.Ca.MR.362.00.0.0]
MTPTSPPATKGVTDEMAQRILGALEDFRDKEPEENESWESWHFAAFDLAVAKVKSILASLSLPPPGEGEAIRDQTISDCALAVWKELSETPAYADAMHLAERAVRALRVSPAAPELAVKDGWVLVPKEPTAEMIAAVNREFGFSDGVMSSACYAAPRIYRAMLTASPQQGEKA